MSTLTVNLLNETPCGKVPLSLAAGCRMAWASWNAGRRSDTRAFITSPTTQEQFIHVRVAAPNGSAKQAQARGEE